MLSSIITSQTRIKLLKKFFLNGNTTCHLRGLEAEFGESSNAIRIELNRFEKAGLLTSIREGNKKLFKANQDHPLFNDIHNIVLKESGIDLVIERVISRLGSLCAIYLTGEFATGRDSREIELVLIGSELNRGYMEKKILQAETFVGRKVSYKLVSPEGRKDFIESYDPKEILQLWSADIVE